MATNGRPTTCGKLAATDATLGEPGCKRLPRHGGEHRGHLTAAAERKAAREAAKPKASKPKAGKRGKMVKADRKAVITALREAAGVVGRKRPTNVQRRAIMAALSGRVTDGALRADDALGIAALL